MEQHNKDNFTDLSELSQQVDESSTYGQAVNEMEALDHNGNVIQLQGNVPRNKSNKP